MGYGLLLGAAALLLGYEAFGKKSSSGTPAKTGGTGGLVPCVDASKDCDALTACAMPIIAKATAADAVTLTKMMVKANALGCTDVVKLVTAKMKDLGLGGVGVKLPPADDLTSGYSIRHGVGPVTAVGDGDMIIVGLTDATKSRNYITPLIFSNPSSPTGTYEKALAGIALSKFKDQVASTGVDPTALLGAFAVSGPPDDLKDGASFPIGLASLVGLGDVMAVVTAAQMKSGLSASPATLASPAFATALVSGEQSNFLATPPALVPTGIGSPFGRRFGAGSRFGGVNVGG